MTIVRDWEGGAACDFRGRINTVRAALIEEHPFCCFIRGGLKPGQPS